MLRLARIALVVLLAFGLVACGSDDSGDGAKKPDDSTSTTTEGNDDQDDSGAGDSDYPTNASINDYCAAFKGEDQPELGPDAAVGEFVGFVEDRLEGVLEVGVPEKMTDAEVAAFERQIDGAGDVLDELRSRNQSAPVKTLQDDKELESLMSEKLETPDELRAFSSENC